MPSFEGIWEILKSINGWWLVEGLRDSMLTGVIGAIVAWWLFRTQWKRFSRGESDDIIFSAHYLLPVPGEEGQLALVLRNPLPPSTVSKTFDNPAARKLVQDLTRTTSIENPILHTEGRLGFEVLNDLMNLVTGALAVTAFTREVWLCVLTCEDRAVVRKRCVRLFLIRPDDLRRFADWEWCQGLYLERHWHHFRVHALHRIAKAFLEEEEAHASDAASDLMPLVHDQAGHRRIVPISIGLNAAEVLVTRPARVEWKHVAEELKALGLTI